MTEEARGFFELTQNAMAGIDSQFQFWLTITFGIVVASFLGRDELTRLIRVVLAVLYLLTVALIVTKTMAYSEMGYNLARLGELNENAYVPYVLAIRIAVTSLGTVAATAFVLIPSLARKSSGPHR